MLLENSAPYRFSIRVHFACKKHKVFIFSIQKLEIPTCKKIKVNFILFSHTPGINFKLLRT